MAGYLNRYKANAMINVIEFPKMCSAYLLKQDGSIVIEGTNFEPSGPGGLASNIRCRLSKELIQKHLGRFIIEIANETKIVKGAEVDDKEYMRTFLHFCGGKKRYKEAANEMDLLSFSIRGNGVTIYLYVYDKKYGSYLAMNDLPEVKCHLTEQEVGMAALSAFERIAEYQANLG